MHTPQYDRRSVNNNNISYIFNGTYIIIDNTFLCFVDNDLGNIYIKRVKLDKKNKFIFIKRTRFKKDAKYIIINGKFFIDCQAYYLEDITNDNRKKIKYTKNPIYNFRNINIEYNKDKNKFITLDFYLPEIFTNWIFKNNFPINDLKLYMKSSPSLYGENAIRRHCSLMTPFKRNDLSTAYFTWNAITDKKHKRFVKWLIWKNYIFIFAPNFFGISLFIMGALFVISLKHP